MLITRKKAALNNAARPDICKVSTYKIIVSQRSLCCADYLLSSPFFLHREARQQPSHFGLLAEQTLRPCQMSA